MLTDKALREGGPPLQEWEIYKLKQFEGRWPVEIPKGWEPFAVTRDGSMTCTIWLRREKKP